MCGFAEFKITISGVGSVGKSEINLQFSGLLCDFDICRKRIVVDEKECVVELTDLSSADEFQAMKHSFIEWADGYVLVYSVTDRNSFEDIPSIHARILCIKDRTHMPMILVGNKCDLDLDRVVSYRQGEVLAESLDIKFLETSAKDGTNVDQVFYDLVRDMQRCKAVTKEKQQQQQQRRKCCVL